MEDLTPDVKDILIGTTLGDGYLEQHGRGVRLQVVHSVRFKEYIEWKHKQLRVLGCSPIHLCKAEYPFFRFVTKIHCYLAELKRIFYCNKRKIIPDSISDLLKTPLALTVWYMDDATRGEGKYPAIKFETQILEEEDISKLKLCLQRNFEIQSAIHKSGKNRGLRLYIPAKGAVRLNNLIKPYILPCMEYKLPYPCND